MTTSARSAARLRLLAGDLGAARLARPLHEGHAPLVAPDGGRPEDVIAEGMVEVAVRVHDDRDRVARQLAEVVQDLAALDVRRCACR